MAKKIGGGEKPQSKGWGHEYDDAEELFNVWSGSPSGMLVPKDENLIPVEIEIHGKKFVALPKWEDCTAEEIFEWWIR